MSHEVVPDYSEAPYPEKYAKSVRRTQRILRSFWHLNIVGQENIPIEGPGVVAFVHRSLADPWVLGASVPRAISGMGKIELQGWPLAGKYLANRGVFFVNRERMSPSTYRAALGVLGDDHLLAMAPEGTSKNKGREIGPTKLGAGSIALKAISDIARDNTNDQEPDPLPVIVAAMSTEHFWLRQPVYTVFAKPILVAPSSGPAYERKVLAEDLNEQIRQIMQSTHETALNLAETKPR